MYNLNGIGNVKFIRGASSHIGEYSMDGLLFETQKTYRSIEKIAFMLYGHPLGRDENYYYILLIILVP